MSWKYDFPFGIEYVAQLLNLRTRRPCTNGVYTDCPFCGDKRGKLKVDYQEDVWRCNYCGESGGMLDLYGRLKNLTTSESYREIYETILNGDGWNDCSQPVPPNTQGLQAERKTEEVQKSPLAEIPVIHATLSALLEMLNLSEKHREHLRKERKLTDEEIECLGYKSTPPFFKCVKLARMLIEQGYTVEGVPGFYVKDGKWTINFSTMLSGILLPVRGVEGMIRGFQIRLDVPLKDKDDPKDKTGAKYVWHTSAGKPQGVSACNPIHCVGDMNARVVYLTEGILKADIAHFVMKRNFIAVVGINNTSGLDLVLSYLANHGTQTIIAAPDMDRYRNKMVRKGIDKIGTKVRNCGMEFRLLTWNPNYKGVDDWQLALKRSEPIPKEYVRIEDCPLSQVKRQKYRIYQLKISEDTVIPFAFGGLNYLHKQGLECPPAELYRVVMDGEMQYADGETIRQRLQRLKDMYGYILPDGYRGRHIAPSDVLEFYDDAEKRYFYCEEKGFAEVDFLSADAEPIE